VGTSAENILMVATAAHILPHLTWQHHHLIIF